MSTLNLGKNNASALPPPPSWTQSVPAGLYHAAARSGTFVSSSMLREFRRCPAMYRDIVAGRTQPLSSSAMRLGSAAHTLILEGPAAYHSRYTVAGPTNPRTGRPFAPGGKTHARWLAASGLAPELALTPAEHERVLRLRDAVQAHPEAAGLLVGGWPERTVRADWRGAACQVRLDWLRPDGRVTDLKTVADLDRFERDAARFGYLHQFAFYRDVTRSAGGEGAEISAVVVEKKPPFRVGVWHFSAAALAPASARNSTDVRLLLRCRETGVWPTGYERARSFADGFAGGGLPAAWLN